MSPDELEYAFAPVFEDIENRAQVAERFIDRNLYQIYIATLWSNVVMNPADVGMSEDRLPELHDLVNNRLTKVLGGDASLHSCFSFINSKAGEKAMAEASLTQTHKELLLYFSSMILDPEGHKRWMEEVSNKPG
jgi:hypothetical protein